VISVLQVVLTPTHLGIVMEYAAGGELFERICSAGRFSEDEVIFQIKLFKSFQITMFLTDFLCKNLCRK